MHGNRQKSGETDAGRGPLLAVLDLGTNNCRLLIAAPVGTGPNVGFRIVDSFSRIVRLGEGVNQTGRKYRGALVFDIGGGSTEVIWLEKGRTGPEKRLAASVPVGVVSLAESYGPASTSRTGFERMRADLRARFEPLAQAMQGNFDTRKYHLLGTSGTVTTLAAIALKLPRYNRTKVDGSWHETSHMLRVVDRLLGQDLQALAKIGPIGAERADLMLPGCAIFSAICSLWASPVLRVADRGLREGMLRQLIRNLS
jgi:exopolyphosphatase/guanosine-5'-triphosphate,3'-diphosphate pyrophosphatase